MQEEMTAGRSVVESMSAEEMSERIREFSRETLAELADRREKAYALASANFSEELRALARESDALETESKSTAERLASAERVTRFRADELILQRKDKEAQATLAGLEEIRGELARIEARRGEIAERCREIETAKKTELRRGAESFLSDCTGLIRGTESGLALILDGTRDALNSAETQLGVSVYRPDQLTCDEKSAEWRTLSRLYSVRTR